VPRRDRIRAVGTNFKGGLMKKLIIIILCLMFAGCAVINKPLMENTDKEIRAQIEYGKFICKNWPFWSAIIRSGFGEERLDLEEMLPVKSFVDEMDALVVARSGMDIEEIDIDTPIEYSMHDAGSAIGMHFRAAWPTVLALIRQYAPNILDLLPTVLLL
jgi:hypothetical protein